MAKSENRDLSPPLPLAFCPDCRARHAANPLLTLQQISAYTQYSIASLYTWSSKGGTLPRPYGYRGGRKLFSSCSIHRWITGQLDPSEVQPVREKKAR